MVAWWFDKCFAESARSPTIHDRPRPFNKYRLRLHFNRLAIGDGCKCRDRFDMRVGASLCIRVVIAWCRGNYNECPSPRTQPEDKGCCLFIISKATCNYIFTTNMNSH